ncbi:glycosyltransferase [Shewanella surugensis]|uniref:Glycosyltransferase family 2 protein n=1 Tax=Shewanella surugensis TaxID=212020 RepID=A0ABT0LCZ1_9GAMM|nr:glycosyltransferase family 2 protein [Shewanella surugensis]MCL1125185.1 glycosyltransferase family 2 protein [Shewanella surugensis]
MLNYLKSQQILRWYLLLLPTLWSILFLANFLWNINPQAGNYFALFIWGLQAIMMLLMMLASGYFFTKMLIEDKKIITQQEKANTKHLIILPCYKEPIEVINQSLTYLLNQTINTKNNVILIVSFEEKSPQLEESRQFLLETYQEQFYFFNICVHPENITKEIPGKCSNERFAVKYALSILDKKNCEFTVNNTLITVMDSDTLLHRRYLEYIANDFERQGQTRGFNIIWQAALFYNWNLNHSSFFTRITALFRSIWMIGFNIPFQVHSMSVYSSSLKLCIDNDFFDPTYQMEDMHYFVSSMNTRMGKVKLHPIYLPVICGPTSGENWQEELSEWHRQAKRWSIGAFEIFHYICTKAPNMGLMITARLALTLTLLYGLFQSIIFFATLIAIPVLHHYQQTADAQLWYIFGMIPWLFIIWVFCIDRLFVHFFNLEKEKVGLFRNILHIFLTPFVLLSYNLVSFFSLHILAIRGKSVCKHDPSEKSNLAKFKQNSPK